MTSPARWTAAHSQVRRRRAHAWSRAGVCAALLLVACGDATGPRESPDAGPRDLQDSGPADGSEGRPSARAVLVGACEVVRLASAPEMCRGLALLLDCSSEHCELDGCFDTCQEYVQCLEATGDPCVAAASCSRSPDCLTCTSALMGCTFGQHCKGIYRCATPTEEGPCTKVEACCASQSQRLAAACSSWVQSIATLGGDASCTMLMHDEGFLSKLASDSPCTFE